MAPVSPDPDSSSRGFLRFGSEYQPGKFHAFRDPRVINQRSARRYVFVSSSAFFKLFSLLGSAPLSVVVSSAFGVTSVHCDDVQDAA